MRVVGCDLLRQEPMRYSTIMNNENELPKDLNTAHDVILQQSVFLKEQASKIERLEKDLAEAQAAFKKLMTGNRSEKFINPDQQLLEFPEDKELQAVLEAAKREAEETLQKVTYIRSQRKKEANQRSEEFPAHLRREEVKVAIPTDKQKLIDEGKLILLRYEAREVMCYRPAEPFVKRFLEPVFAMVETPEIEAFREEMPAALASKANTTPASLRRSSTESLANISLTTDCKTSLAVVAGHRLVRRSTIRPTWQQRQLKSCPS